ncbi:epoxide hydrolase family protein [Fodinicola acaciae]|uniref:epoxide hydrolase family protein n=1 Tax=Fodinicola acaciae TaxID=2681555 RepID=UPI001FE724F6|nr:epoxide hydrolase family protein [Fodinicola acaciae]
MTEQIRPYAIDVPQAELDELRDRLGRVRWTEELDDAGWDYGVPVDHLRKLVAYWRDEYDWRAWERRLNAYPQFTTEIDGQTIHFLHVRSRRPDALPLLMLHGWPGSVVEYLDVIEPLSADFHLVIPSLPGFGFSGPTKDRGWSPWRMVPAFVELMKRLDYGSYGVVGNDWGSYIAPEIGRAAPDNVVGVHVQQVWSEPSGDPEELARLTEQERAAVAENEWFSGNGGAYDKVHRQIPQTLAHALADSPVGLLAWNGQLWRDSVDIDFGLTNVSIYWLTGTIASAMRIYREFYVAEPVAKERTTVRLGLAMFEYDWNSVRTLADRDHANIASWNVYDGDGHWAAHQATDTYVQDVRAFFGH